MRQRCPRMPDKHHDNPLKSIHPATNLILDFLRLRPLPPNKVEEKTLDQPTKQKHIFCWPPPGKSRLQHCFGRGGENLKLSLLPGWRTGIHYGDAMVSRGEVAMFKGRRCTCNVAARASLFRKPKENMPSHAQGGRHSLSCNVAARASLSEVRTSLVCP